MTTIILTIIGILLAAAAALMVIFYGGDAFNAGSVGARANTLQNAGTNVLSALQLAKADGKVASTLTIANLQSGTGDDNYLKELPSFASVNSKIANATDVGLDTGRVFTVAKVPAAVCARVNKNLGVASPAAVPTAAAPGTIKMGCFSVAADGTDGGASTFFAVA
jgi:hypothetical protein